jgi:hypothetical protein
MAPPIGSPGNPIRRESDREGERSDAMAPGMRKSDPMFGNKLQHLLALQHGLKKGFGIRDAPRTVEPFCKLFQGARLIGTEQPWHQQLRLCVRIQSHNQNHSGLFVHPGQSQEQ